MPTLSSSIGLISNINFVEIVDQLIAIQRRPIALLEQRAETYRAEESGLKTLEANLLTLTTSVQQLNQDSTFGALGVNNSNKASLLVTAGQDAAPGEYRFQPIRTASTHQVRSQGLADPSEQTFSAGTISIFTGGRLHQPTELDALNGGNGVQRGVIRITDRSGAAAEIDLSSAFTVDDVLDAINSSGGVSVAAAAQGGRLVIKDLSGGSASNLIVEEVNAGRTAQDLGIAASVAAEELVGSDVYALTEGFTLDQINDGNAVRLIENAPDIRVTLTDDTVIEVNLDGVSTLGGIVQRINDHEDNNGKLSATLVDGRLELDDLSGGGGSSPLTVEDINDASVVRQIGLDTAASGTNITGRRLLAGLNSVLLANLRGGLGIDQTGQISLTDRAGVTATVDLSTAESLDEVLDAINAAESSDGTKLQLSARIDELGGGIIVSDTSGQAASNLIIADVGASTLADQLGIAVDAAVDSVESGSLSFRYVNAATDVDAFVPQTGSLSTGSVLITDSAGNQSAVEFSDAVETVGDVLQRINAATGISVRAELNDTGDGILLIDEAGGSGTLTVEEVDGTVASELRILGSGVVGSDGKQRISGRLTTIVDVAEDDTLETIVQRINDAGGSVTASLIDDGSAFNSTRLVLTSVHSGSAGRFVVDDGGIGLDLNVLATGQDALLRVGADAQSGFLIRSESNTFENVATGIDVEVRAASAAPADVTVFRDTSQINKALESFVAGFNGYVDTAAKLTRFDPETNERGILQGSGIVLRVTNRLSSLVTRQYFSAQDPIRSLSDLGIRIGAGGKLTLDDAQLAEALETDPEAVADFFLAAEGGFAAIAEETLDSVTDPLTGTFALEENSLQASVDSLSERIQQLDLLLESRRERMLQEFIFLEQILGQLTSQQQAIGSILPLNVESVGTGILGN